MENHEHGPFDNAKFGGFSDDEFLQVSTSLDVEKSAFVDGELTIVVKPHVHGVGKVFFPWVKAADAHEF